MFKISQGAQELALQAYSTALSGSMVMRIYDGPVPTNAHDAIGVTNTLLREVSAGGVVGAGMSFEASTVSGMLVKSTSEVWQGPTTGNAASGTATFYRLVLYTDDGSADTAAVRFQGSVGLLDADLILGNTALVIGSDDPAIGIYGVGLPLE